MTFSPPTGLVQVLTALGVMTLAFATICTARAVETKVPVTFSGGHDIGKSDFGRPVALIAAALGVKPEVFRKAFSGVTPARGRGPTGEEARKNKSALLKVLAPHGVTNERLDEVSNYYRFRPQEGELWPTAEAEAHAIVANGKVKRIVVTKPGSGYCTPPQATVTGFPDLKLTATLTFGQELEKNGGIAKVEMASAKKSSAKKPSGRSTD